MDYFSWQYLYAPRKIILIWKNFLIFILHLFSIKKLFLHLLSPWKRLTLKKGPGFKIKEILNVFSYNLVSRLMGAIARSTIILSGLIALIFTLVFGFLILITWLFLPGFTLPFYYLSLKKEPKFPDLKTNPPFRVLEEFLKTKKGVFFQKRLNLNFQEIGEKTSFFSFENLPKDQDSWDDLIIFLTKNWPPFSEFLSQNFLDENDVKKVLDWFKDQEKEKERKRRFWELENLLTIKPFGQDLIYGYTPNLDKYSTNLGAPLPYWHHLVGRQNEARMVEQILSRSAENNVLILGEPGVGRTTIVLNFARIVTEGRVNPFLSRKRVLELNINSILGEAKDLPERKKILEEILEEAALAGNVILVIKNIDLYFSSKDERIDLTDVFLKYLSGRDLQIIGITTFWDFQKYLYPNREIIKYFEKIEVSQPTKEEALLILQRISPVFEERTKTFITYQAIKETIEKSDQYLTDLPFPEKAIDLLDEVCVAVSQSGKTIILKEDVDWLLSKKTKIPIGEIVEEEKEKLKKLEEILHQRVINQEEAIKEIAKAMRRARTEISAKNKPIGSFLFLGPTGVGKTETAKALAFAYFGSEEKMIRFNMAEYQGKDSLEKAIGSFTLKEPGFFAQKIRENPFSLLLIDEVEKTNPRVLNLFLSILDEGYFQDAFGREVDCRNLIIIATSNAGGEFIREKVSLGQNEENLKNEVIEYVLKNQIFSPEFINRFDAVVVFKPLKENHLREIARLLLKDLNSRLAKKNYQIKITNDLIEKIAKLGYDPAFGARPMKRVIQNKIEDQIAQKILRGEIKMGEEIEIKIE